VETSIVQASVCTSRTSNEFSTKASQPVAGNRNPSPQTKTLNSLQAVAQDYAAHGLTCIPAIDKIPAIKVEPWLVQPPSDYMRNAMFSEPGLNIAVICGAASGGFFQIDCETEREFDRQYELCHQAGISGTWIDRTPSKGGHLWFRLPYAVKTRGLKNDVEVLAQGRITIAPPSVAHSKIDGSLQPYTFAQRTPQILTLESSDQVHWLNLEKVSLSTTWRALPRKARKLLDGKDVDRYETRSEAEMAIVVCMVNAGFIYEDIRHHFQNNPAAGHYASLQYSDKNHAEAYLRHTYNEARTWCANVSPARRNALELLKHAQSMPWHGRSGSSMRAVFIAHCGLSYRSGGPTYHASARDLAEWAGCDKTTAATATRRLLASKVINPVQESSFTFAGRYSLPDARSLEKQTNSRTLTNKACEGVSVFRLFLLPEAFRPRGLGRSAYEVLQALGAGPLTAPQLAANTGRNVKTVRDALKRLKKHGLVAKTGKYWRGRAIEDIDEDQLTRAACMRGAASAQKERHTADRLRRKIRLKLHSTNKANTERQVKK
jgi:hypothetical protein